MSSNDCLWGLAAVVLFSCTADDALVPDILESDPDFEYTREGDMAIAMPRHHELFLASGSVGPQAVFLSFDALTIHRAGWYQNNSQDDSSFVPDIATSDVPAFSAAPWPGTRQQVISQIIAGVAADYAAYDVEITATRPAQGSYTMIVVGGRPTDIGIANANLLGVAPFDSTNWNANDVGFVFSESAAQYGYTARELAHTISHELGHTLGLRHILRESDIMQPAACHCAQTFGAGPLADDPQYSQDSNLILSSVFPASEPVPDPDPIDPDPIDPDLIDPDPVDPDPIDPDPIDPDPIDPNPEDPVEPLTCGPGDAWIEAQTQTVGTPCGNTCSGYHWSWCDYDGDGSSSDGWQFCLSSGWASCSYHPH